MEPTHSQVRIYCSQTNQDAHLERALTFKNSANLHCLWNICLPVICLCALYCGLPMSLTSLKKQDDITAQEIGDDESDTRESTLLCDMQEDDSDHLEVLLQGPTYMEMSFRGTPVPLAKKISCANTVIATPPLPNFPNRDEGMPPPPLLKWQCQPSSTSYPSLTVHHLPRCCHYTSLVETRMLNNPRPVEVKMFSNTKRLLVR